MYQGKFDARSRGQNAPDQTLDNIIREREEANALREAKRAAREAKKRPAAGAAPAAPAQNRKRPAPAPQQRRPAQPASLTPEQKAARAMQSGKQTENEVVLKKKGSRTGSMIFYTFYFALIFIFFIGIFIGLNWLNGWLKDYEAAQPTVICQQVFDQLFKNPDWSYLYRLAGDPTGTGANSYDTQFEGVEQYVQYMQEKVGSQELNFVETSGGLNGKKYIVRLGTERLATFTLSGQQKSITDIPDWELGKVELLIDRDKSIQIRKLDTHVAYINGYPLSDDYTIQTAYTKADEKLNEADRVVTSIQEVSGLLAEPELLVYDQTGAPISVLYNADSGMYEEQISAIAISEEERSAVFGALEAYAGSMINASGSRTKLAQYFDGGSQTYKDIIGMSGELWMNSDRGHEFRNEEILGYTKHSDTMFSVRASMVMHVINKDNTEKDYSVIQSMYFQHKNGKWVCTEMTNEDITAPVGEVRLTFCDVSGNVISSDFYATTTSQIAVPSVEVPAGRQFIGWATVEVGSDGQKTWNVVFQPDETNIVYPTGDLLPMVLHPLFQNIPTQGGETA